MLKISSRTHYGLRAMVELAKTYGSGPLPLSEIARTENLPLAYLEQLVADLRRARLVEGTRGLHGGYCLTRAPAQTTVGDIVRALEGPLSLVECLGDGYEPGQCERETDCVSRSMWHQVKQSMEQILDATTLDDLRLGQSSSQMLLPTAAAESIPRKVG